MNNSINELSPNETDSGSFISQLVTAVLFLLLNSFTYNAILCCITTVLFLVATVLSSVNCYTIQTAKSVYHTVRCLCGPMLLIKDNDKTKHGQSFDIRRLNCICKVAPKCTPISYMVCSFGTHTYLVPYKEHLDWFSNFWTARRCA